MSRDSRNRIVPPAALAGLTAAAGGIAAIAAVWIWRSRRARSPGLTHRADGTDDSASLSARIADEGMIPDIDLGASAPAEPVIPIGEDADTSPDPAVPHFPEELAIPARAQ